jgi:hypothetical protein
MNKNNESVDKALFTAATESLQRHGIQASVSNAPEPSSDYTTAIGKITMSLNIEGDPGLDLTEVVLDDKKACMVLVSAVTQATQDQTGLQALDTIVRVSTSDAVVDSSTVGLTLPETATILMGASKHALENGLTEVQLEINRLIKLYYADPNQLKG